MINSMIEIIATIIDVILLVYFVPKFNHNTFYNKKWTLVFPVVQLAFQLIADHFLQGFDVLYILFVFIISATYSLILCKKRFINGIFAAGIYVVILMLSSSIIYPLFSMIIENVDSVLYGSSSFVRIIYIAIGKVLQFSFFKIVLLILKADNTLGIKNGILAVSISVATAFGLGALMSVALKTESDYVNIAILITVSILIFINFALYFLINQVQKLEKDKFELQLINERKEYDKARSDEASTIWNKIREVRHDLKNHFSVLSGLLNKGDVNECKEYISSLYNTVESMGDLIKSDNAVIDYLVNSKLSNLENVKTLVTGYIGNYDDVEDADLACILGNILDNAVEAQESITGEKRIELHFLTKNTNRIIICKNTVSDSVLANNKALKSTKKDPEYHGLGHHIIESTAEKYHGWVDYFEDDGMFGVQVMLPIQNK